MNFPEACARPSQWCVGSFSVIDADIRAAEGLSSKQKNKHAQKKKNLVWNKALGSGIELSKYEFLKEKLSEV